MSLSRKQQKFVNLASAKYGEGAVVTKDEVETLMEESDIKWPGWFSRSPYMVGRGRWKLPVNGETVAPVTVAPVKKTKPVVVENTTTEENTVVAYYNPDESLVPGKDRLYVPFGYFGDVSTIVTSNKFYPVFITGLSGNGKTLMVEQVCAKAKRELFRVNITVETDEDDLLGHYTLVDGNTVWQDGPVIKAMERGAILLLDEIDLASNKIMCLQPVLEGKGVYLKKINRFVKPAIGFNVLATANTKGKGSEDGRFIGTNILNEAFLERFPITIEQEYAPTRIETKILKKLFVSLDLPESDFPEKLVSWADAIRKVFYEGGIDEIIATRRLVHITNAYAIFGDRKKAIEMCINRFDDDTKTTFLDLYSKIDTEVTLTDEVEEASSEEEMTVEEDYKPF